MIGCTPASRGGEGEFEGAEQIAGVGRSATAGMALRLQSSISCLILIAPSDSE